jgi:hypothetical protein
MTRTLRAVVGRGQADPAAVGRLALAAADQARGRGLKLIRISASHAVDSGSRYLHVEDARGQRWVFRVSNHRRPQRENPNEAPHFDLVSIDAASGLGQLGFWMDEIVAVRIEWFRPEPFVRRPRQRRRGR